MRFLAPWGGDIGDAYGVLTAPGHVGIPQAIREGALWAGDNQAFTNGFDPETFFPFVAKTVGGGIWSLLLTKLKTS